MGRRGPAPEPVALRILKGETRPSRLGHAPRAQDPPAMPEDLSPTAQRVWQATLIATANTFHIGQAHLEIFRQFCEATAALNAMTPKGTKEWRELAASHLRLATALCLTPATGAGLAKKPTTSRTIDKYISRTG